MTILRGHFAMMLIVSTPAAPAEIEEALAPVAADGSLMVSVRAVAAESGESPLERPAPYQLSVHGTDRPGIVSAITRVLAGAGGNITDLTTRLAGDLYLLVAEVDVPGDADVDRLTAELTAAGDSLGVDVVLRPGDVDLL
jgi:glycine cleavage system transcriptional repressor